MERFIEDEGKNWPHFKQIKGQYITRKGVRCLHL